MSLSQLFFKEPNIIGDSSTLVIELDVIVSEGATATATKTRNPVESGADTNDHIRIEPMTFTMSGVVSDTPVKFLAGIQSGGILSGNKQSRTAWDSLLQLHALRQPFTLVQGLKTYENVVLLKLSTTQNVSNFRALQFTAEMEELILVGVKELTGDNFNEPIISAGMTANSDQGLKDL